MSTMTLAALKSEIQNDPKGRGYAAQVVAGDSTAVANLLNSTYAGVAKTYKSNVKASVLATALLWSEIGTFTQTQWTAFGAIFALFQTGVDATDANIRGLFAGLFAGKTNTLAGLDAKAAITNPTRAQELWGEDARISFQDVDAALAS